MNYLEKHKKTFLEMKAFLLLWATQAFSGLGSAMTGYALVIWSYTKGGSGAYDIASYGMHVYAVCSVQHFCGCAQRPLG